MAQPTKPARGLKMPRLTGAGFLVGALAVLAYEWGYAARFHPKLCAFAALLVGASAWLALFGERFEPGTGRLERRYARGLGIAMLVGLLVGIAVNALIGGWSAAI
ncbi:MAG: hypothetical protein HY744_06950 [Deltaproteobacteria bacterium]|nr:hypothetical protein [Deltaproteobacteria bacterium]